MFIFLDSWVREPMGLPIVLLIGCIADLIFELAPRVFLLVLLKVRAVRDAETGPFINSGYVTACDLAGGFCLRVLPF